jgi:hypothetical protein
LPLVPFTAGSWVAICDTWPALQPPRATLAARAHPARPAATAEVREWKRFTELSCRAGETTVMRSRWFDCKVPYKGHAELVAAVRLLTMSRSDVYVSMVAGLVEATAS